MILYCELSDVAAKVDSIWVWVARPERKLFQVKPDKDHKFVLSFKEKSNVLFTFGTDVPKVSSSPIFIEKGDQLSVVTDFDKHIALLGIAQSAMDKTKDLVLVKPLIKPLQR